LSGLAKVPGVCEYIEELLDNDIKFILFAHHSDVMNKLEDFIKTKKVLFMRIDGSTP